MSRPRMPGTPIVDGAKWVLGLLAGAAVFLALTPAGGDLRSAAADLDGRTFERARAVERDWIDQAFGAHYSLAPPVQAPCPEGLTGVPRSLRTSVRNAMGSPSDDALAQLTAQYPDAWLPPLALAHRLLGEGKNAAARRELATLYGRSKFQRLAGGSRLDDEELRAAIHVLHALGYAQMETNSQDPGYFWKLVKNPIGRVRLLSEGGGTDRRRGTPTWSKHRIRAPGCATGNGPVLTSFDLYNNLIVAYLVTPGFQESPARRDREFRRDYSDPLDENPLQHLLRRAVERHLGDREGWVWALSNAEVLLRDRRANGQGPPEDSRLSLNLASLALQAESLIEDGEVELEQALWRQVEVLTVAAGASALPEDPKVAAALGRLRLLVAGRNGDALPRDAASLRTRWNDPQRGAADAAEAAVFARSGSDGLAAALSGEVPDPLGKRSAAWLEALRRDAAGAVAAGALSEADAGLRAREARRARRLLADAEAPRALGELEATLPWGPRLKQMASVAGRSLPSRLAAALAVAALVWLAVRRVALELRFRKALWTSFYRLEALGRRGRR
ncbi:MAG: hypothetical protein AAGN66_13975 [Acidobacteriota bacterium]